MDPVQKGVGVQHGLSVAPLLLCWQRLEVADCGPPVRICEAMRLRQQNQELLALAPFNSTLVSIFGHGQGPSQRRQHGVLLAKL